MPKAAMDADRAGGGDPLGFSDDPSSSPASSPQNTTQSNGGVSPEEDAGVAEAGGTMAEAKVEDEAEPAEATAEADPEPLPEGDKIQFNRRDQIRTNPTLDPYFGKLERYELFCTNQSYYLVGCNKQNTSYRVLKMDRTLIEKLDASSAQQQQQLQQQPQPTQVNPSASNASSSSDPQAAADAAHIAKPTLRPLSEFLTEDPNVYSQDELYDMLDMIHDGNRLRREGRAEGGGLKPIAKAYGIVGFVRFLDCYYPTQHFTRDPSWTKPDVSALDYEDQKFFSPYGDEHKTELSPQRSRNVNVNAHLVLSPQSQKTEDFFDGFSVGTDEFRRYQTDDDSIFKTDEDSLFSNLR